MKTLATLALRLVCSALLMLAMAATGALALTAAAYAHRWDGFLHKVQSLFFVGVGLALGVIAIGLLLLAVLCLIDPTFPNADTEKARADG